jgi:regulator of replication initiation timing
MFKLLEKWVNERGSANIMEKRLGLKDDEITAMHRELTSLISEHSQLQSENEQLKVSLDTATQEAARLQKIINSATEAQSGDKLDEAKEQILKKFFETNSYFTTAQLSQSLSMDESLVQYHIDALKDSGLVIHGALRVNSPVTFKISSEGRKVVVEQIGI